MMKKYLCLLAFMVGMSHFSAMAQSKAIDKFVRQVKKNNRSTKSADCLSLKLGGWLIRTGLAFSDKPELDLVRPLVKGLDRVHILVLDNGNAPSAEAIQALANDLQDEKFEYLMQVREKGSRVSVLSRDSQNGEIIKDIVLLVKDQGGKDFVLLRLEGDFKLSDIQKVIDEAQKNKSVSNAED